MRNLSEKEIIKKIEAGDSFECEIEDGSFHLKIDSYTPVIFAAVHSGHKFRDSLEDYCNLTEYERLYEEDPLTDLFIEAMPITITANDSRYEYDLNRPLSKSIYDTAWGKEVWNEKLPENEKLISTEKHKAFYRVLDVLVKKIEDRFGAALVFDIHSYNYERIENGSPTFNLGTEKLDKKRWEEVLNQTMKKLKGIKLPNIKVTAEKNKVFFGRGYLVVHISSKFENTLVLSIEVKKIYMNESNGEQYPLVIRSLSSELKNCLVDISSYFSKRFSSKKYIKKTQMLAEKPDPAVAEVDRQLFNLAKELDTLYYINPINIPAEKKNFMKNPGGYEPKFRYNQLNIDPYTLREQLYHIPVDTIRDPSIEGLYRDVINGLSEKTDLLAKAGQPDFVYESLKYYGEPGKADEKNASFLLHAAKSEPYEYDNLISHNKIIELFKAYIQKNEMECDIEVSSKLVASAMVLNRRRVVLLAEELSLPEKEVNALISHELGVHMATSLNANQQHLKVFELGLPGSTVTQEGLAVFNEYLSGNLTINRLKILALRVVAVKEMLKEAKFSHTYNYLLEEENLSSEDAFTLSLRVHRGGGFTKDYLYLGGIKKALKLYQSKDITNLFVGKTGFDYLPLIDEMVERHLVKKPEFVPEFLRNPSEKSPVINFLVNCISDETD